MSNYTRNTLTGDLAPINAELEKVQNAIADKLDRVPSVSQANQLNNILDVNSNRIINLPAPASPNDAARLVDVAVSTGTSVLPVQTGQNSKYLKTDGTTPFWSNVTKAEVGLSNVENTTDALKPISTAQQTALNLKLNVEGMTTTSLINSTATYSADTIINTIGFAASGDGGGWGWKQNGVTGQTVSQSPAQLGNALLNDGNGDVWALVHGGTIDPLKLGATEAAEDNYDFLQAALNGGKIIDLQSNYFDYNGTLTSSKVGAGIIGNGSATCGIRPTNTTSNNISFADPAGPMRGAVFKGFSIKAIRSSVAGKAIKLDGVRLFVISDVIIDRGFWGMHFIGCSQGNIDNVTIIYENDNGGVITGRKYIRIEETANVNVLSEHSADLFFTNINGRCGALPYCEYGIEIHSGDGIWFDNYHIGSCTGANVYINADRTTRCTGLKFANGWHDIGTGKGTWIKGTTPNTIGDYTFNSVRHLGGNGGDVGIEIDGDATEIVFDGPDTTVSGYLKQGIIIKAAFTGSCEIKAHVYKCSLAGSGLYDGIKDESTTASVKIENCTVSGTNHRYHINSQIAKPTTIRNNDVSVDNAVTGALSYVHTTGLIVEGNRGFNPVGASSDPVLPSPWTITNDLGYNLQLVIHGGTGVSFVMNGTTIQAARNEGTFTLPKDGDIVITYTTAPYVYFIGM